VPYWASDGSEDAEDPRGLPKYDQNAPSVNGVNNIPQTGTKYIVVPGSKDGTVPPVEVPGDVFTYCMDQMSEIMMGFAQTGAMTVTMTRDWCRYQASVTTWVGKEQEFGHPDWDSRTCEGMSGFVAYALKDDLNSGAGLSSHHICGKLFGAKGAIHRVEQLVKEAWVGSFRSPPEVKTVEGGTDPEMEAKLAAAQKYAQAIYGKMNAQKTAFDDLNAAKMDTAAFESHPPDAAAQPAPQPPLPDAGDFDPNAVSFLVMTDTRLRQWGNGQGAARL
jgi:hypothetical protein